MTLCLHQRFFKLYPPKEESSIYTVTTEYPAALAMQGLRARNIFCCPVVDERKEERLVSLISLADICAYTVRMWDHLSPKDDFDHHFVDTLRGVTAGQLANYSKLNECNVMHSEKTTFREILILLSSPHVQRVPMVGTASFLSEVRKQRHRRPLERFLTQSDIIAFVHLNMSVFKPILDKKVDFSIGSRPVITIDEQESTINGFRMLLDKEISAVGVVDTRGALVGSLSLRDIRQVIHPDTGTREELASSLGEFLEGIYSKERASVLVCKEGDTMGSVIEKIYDNKGHRVFTVDSDGLPSSIISLTDILKFLCNNLISDGI